MSTSETFLIGMIIILTVPYMVWRMFRTEYYAPLVVIQIVCGILLGPGILGAIFPHYYSFVFNPPVISALNGITWWGVMIFVWIAGIELDVKRAWRNRAETTITAGLALGAPLVLGSLAAIAILALLGDGWVGTNGAKWQFVLAIGMASAVTSLPILVLFMETLGVLRKSLGQRTLRFASLDDVAIWGVLALILLDWNRVGREGGFLILFAGAAYGVRLLMRRIPEKDRWYVGLIWLAVCGFAADWAGMHFMVGAFLAGAVLDSDMFDQEQMDTLRKHVLLVLMPVYFLTTGLRTNWEIGGVAVFGAAALLIVASVGGKLAGVHLAGRILKWPMGEASVIGWLLQTKALIGIVFVTILLDKGIITGAAFTATLLMAVGSTMLTIPMVTPKLARLMSGQAETSLED